MKTPMQEFYEYMEQNQYFIGNDLYEKYHELLEYEKFVMNETWDSAVDDLDEFKTFEEYYNETFKNKREMTREEKTIYKDVKNELPTNTFECVVKMWNQFNDEWVTGIGIYDVPTKKWEVRDNGLGIYSVRFWFAVPNL